MLNTSKEREREGLVGWWVFREWFFVFFQREEGGRSLVACLCALVDRGEIHDDSEVIRE